MRKNKSCFDCKNAFIIEDTSVGIWPGIEDCKVADQSPALANLLNWEDFDPNGQPSFEEILASNCPYFDPFMAEKCAQCHKRIHKPKWNWKFFASDGEPVPVCSEKCKEKYEAKVGVVTS